MVTESLINPLLIIIYLLSSINVIDCADEVQYSLAPLGLLWFLRVEELAEDQSSESLRSHNLIKSLVSVPRKSFF